MSKRAAYVDISPEMLRGLLNLPEKWCVTAMQYRLENDCMRVRIEGDGLPEAESGLVLMRVLPNRVSAPGFVLDWDSPVSLG